MASLSVANAASLNLTWTDNSENEDGFEIERSELTGEFSVLASVSADENSYTDSSVLPGVQYQYRVRAYNAFGYSGYTNVSQGSVGNTPPYLGEVADVVAPSGGSASVIYVSASDLETRIENLAFEVMSSNLSVLPLDGIQSVVQDGMLKLQLATNGEVGSSTISILVSDGIEISQTNFGFQLIENTAPTISSTNRLQLSEAQDVGPISISVSDLESDVEDLVVSAVSLDESLVPSGSIRVEKAYGSARKVFFSTFEGVSGQGTIRLTVSDGLNEAYGAIPFEIYHNEAPTITGLGTSYTLENGARLSGLPFEVGDAETDVSALILNVTSSNSALIAQGGLQINGTGAQRTLSVTPTVLYSGVSEITVSVSDGQRKTEKTFAVSVSEPEEVVEILDFQVEESLSVIEVANRNLAVFSLWKIESRGGEWQKVKDAVIKTGSESTVLIDPAPVTASVCYRVIASQ